MLFFPLIISSVLSTFSEISLSNNSSIAVFPRSYLFYVLLERIFMDLNLICIMCGESIKNI